MTRGKAAKYLTYVTRFGHSDVFFFYKGDFFYKNKASTEKYFELNKDKTAKLVSLGDTRKTHPILGFAYGNDKGRDVFTVRMKTQR